ncbi:MAG: hypothetical protein ABID04_01935 [Patescibacteria group bacterium]
MKNNKPKSISSNKFFKRLVWIGVATLITALIWTALDGYHRLMDDQLSTRFESLLTPLNTTLNSQVIDQLEGKRKYDLNELDYQPEPTVKIGTDSSKVVRGPTITEAPVAVEASAGGQIND